jgi:hypothetical protein
MRLSYTHKFIFLANPKTGSETVRELLNPYSDIKSTYRNKSKYYHHIPASELIHNLNEDKINYKEYYIFGFIRNPWHRAVSTYFYCKPDKNCTPAYADNYDADTKFYYNFNDWLLELKKKNMFPNNTLNGFFKKDNELIANKIYKLEEMDEAFEELNSKLNLNLKNTFAKNSNTYDHYSLYYTKESYEYVKLKMKSDIEYGNYKFEYLNKDLNK